MVLGIADFEEHVTGLIDQDAGIEFMAEWLRHMIFRYNYPILNRAKNWTPGKDLFMNHSYLFCLS